MKINISQYNEAWDEFIRRCPKWAEEAKQWVPRHGHMIRVYLNNGDYVDYDKQSGTYRYVDENRRVDLDDITDENCRKIFSLNLRDLMLARGINQAILAERSGLSQGIISRYLTGRSTPSLTAIRKIARVLQCSPYELME